MTKIRIKEIIRTRRKTLTLSVNPDATLIIKAPLFTPMPFINHFIERNYKWIAKQVALIRSVPKVKKHKFIEGEEFLFLGKFYKLNIGHFISITIDGNYLRFPKSKSEKIKVKLLEWYKKQALEFITSRVEFYAKKMKVKYGKIKVTSAKNRWGSCSHSNNLRFRWTLIMTPVEIIDYVVVHELAHITHKNHSQIFWAYVRNYIPDIKRRIKWLKTNHGLLSI